jgi:CRISPR/Cas system CMR-associated protein Cmr3 (group 5 of RAMP superfamily)
MKKIHLVSVLAFVVLTAIFTSCEKDVEKLTASNFYGAWKSVYDTDDTRIMLFMENNTIYTNASATDAFVILKLTSTDTIIMYEGSFEITEGYLRSYNDLTNYANEITNYKRKEFILYSETAPNYERIYEKTETELLETAPQ